MNYEQEIENNNYPIEISYMPNSLSGHNWYARCWSVKYTMFVYSHGLSIEDVCKHVLEQLK